MTHLLLNAFALPIKMPIGSFMSIFGFKNSRFQSGTPKNLAVVHSNRPMIPKRHSGRNAYESSRGYALNISGTCDVKNPLQLITRVSVAPNTTDDQSLLSNDLENLKGRSEIDELLTDAGYVGSESSRAVEKHRVELKVSGIKGCKKKAGALGLEDFTIDYEEGGGCFYYLSPGFYR